MMDNFDRFLLAVMGLLIFLTFLVLMDIGAHCGSPVNPGCNKFNQGAGLAATWKYVVAVLLATSIGGINIGLLYRDQKRA